MNNAPNIVDLLRHLRDDTTTLLREEVALAKTEITENMSRIMRNIGAIAVAALVGLSALLLLLFSISHWLAEYFIRRGMNLEVAVALGFLIVAIISGIISWGLITKAIATLRNEPVAPAKTVQSLREDKQWAQSKI